MNYTDRARNAEEKKKSQEKGKEGMWLLNDLALGSYLCCCSLTIQVGKANCTRANEHPKLPDFSFSVSLFHAREQM